MKFNTAYGDNPKDPGLVFDPKDTQVQQHLANETDINQIVARAKKTGELPGGQPANFADYSDPMDFQAAVEVIQEAERQFSALPSQVRERFHNDPQRFLEFATNPQNEEEMADLGLLNEKAVDRVKTQKEAKREEEIQKEIEKREKLKPKTPEKP